MANSNEQLQQNMANARSDGALTVKKVSDKMEAWLYQGDERNLKRLRKTFGEEAELVQSLFIDIVNTNPKVLGCDVRSIIQAFSRCINTKLYPGLEASFIVFGKQLQFVPQYGGIIKLALQSGFIKSVWAEVVCEMDEFEVTEGLKRNLIHKKARTDRKTRGKRVAVYACYEGIHGNVEFLIMWPDEVEAIKRRSAAGKSSSSPWNGDAQGNFTDTDWMWKKTAIKQLLKTVPKSLNLSRAIRFDDEAEIPETRKKPISETESEDFIEADMMDDEAVMEVQNEAN